MTATATPTKRVPLARALHLFFDPPPHLSTGIRWCLDGRLNSRGERVKLRSERIGGKRYTTEADVEAFIAALNPDVPEASGVGEATSAERRAAEADRTLEAMGY